MDDVEPEVATAAARVLAAYGGASVEQHLWRRLDQWSAQWRGRAAEFDGHPITGGGGLHANSFRAGNYASETMESLLAKLR